MALAGHDCMAEAHREARPLHDEPVERHDAADLAGEDDVGAEDVATEAGRAARDEEIERLAHRLSDVIEGASPDERAALGEFARSVVEDETERAIQPAAERTGHRPLGTFGSAALLLAGGLFFLIALPPVGIVMLLLGILLAFWGIAQQLVTGHRDAGPSSERNTPSEEDAADGRRPVTADSARHD